MCYTPPIEISHSTITMVFKFSNGLDDKFLKKSFEKKDRFKNTVTPPPVVEKLFFRYLNIMIYYSRAISKSLHFSTQAS